MLPAGTPRVDPSRLLQGDRLGKLLAQARESFDMIIVDAPPVLPVPDALTIGRWTDGAVLAVRYDTSRYPLVERANRRLAARRRPGPRGGCQRRPVDRVELRRLLHLQRLDRRLIARERQGRGAAGTG